MSAAELIARVKSAGVKLFLEDGRLAYEGDEAAVGLVLSEIKANKAELLALLQAARRRTPDPELRRKVLKELAENPGTKYAYVVDNPDTDPVTIGFGIRDVATCELAIPKERFDPLEFLVAIKDMAATA